MGIKRSRVYLEQTWLPRLRAHGPVLDLGKRDYTAHYGELVGSDAYVSVDIDPSVEPDLVADVCSADFVEQARTRHPAYGAILCNGVIGYGVDSPAQLRRCIDNLAQLLRSGGHLLVGWNEWAISRVDLCTLLEGNSLRNSLIEGQVIHAPAETPGYEYLRHHYTLWLRP